MGSQEGEKFLRHNLLRHSRLIRDLWGPTAVPACDTVPGCNHFSVPLTLADPAGRLHELPRRLPGLG